MALGAGREVGHYAAMTIMTQGTADFLPVAGMMSNLIRDYDWSRTPMGCIETWGQAIKTTVGLILRSPVPIVTLWGVDGTMIYNDAYSVFAGRRHPVLLGSAVREGWPEVADFNDNVMMVGMAGGVLSYKNQELTLYRNGRAEQVFMNLDYSPVIGEDGNPIGVVAIVVETTDLIDANQRLAESEARFRALTDSTADAVYRLNGDWSEMHQLDGRGFLADTVTPSAGWIEKYIPDEDLGLVETEIASAVSLRRPFRLEHKVKQANGTVGWVESRAVPIFDAGGQLIEWFGAATDVTARHRAADLHSTQQDRQRRLFEQAPGFIVIMRGPEHIVEFVNDAHRAVFKSGDWPGKSMRDAFPSIEGQGFFEALDQVYTTGKTVQFDATPVAFSTEENGPRSTRYLTFIYAPLFDDDGAVSGIFCEGYDVTAGNLAEEKLKFLDRLAAATAPLSDADDILALTTRLVGQHLGVDICAYADMEADQDHFTIRGDWSAPGSASIRGHYSLAAFGRLAVTNLRNGLPLVVNDNLRELAPEEAATFQSIGIASTICMPLVKDGVLTALMAIHHRGPHVWSERELALLSEVTERSWAHVERTRSAAEAKENSARFQTLAQALPAHVWTAGPDGSLDWFNDRVYSYSGSAPGTLDGDGWAAIVHPDDLGPAWSAWRQALEDGTNYQTEFRLRRADGAWRWHLTRAVPLRDTSWRITKWVGTNTDVDDQKNSEVVLERRLAERTAALAEASDRLQQSQKMKAIGNLTGGVAHDFNNLLSAVMGSLELMRKRLPDDPALTKLLDNAMEGANRGASLTRRMLAFARKQDLRSDRIDPGSLVYGMKDLLERSLGPMVSLQLDLAENLPTVEADANQLESALLNLAVNARDAVEGEGSIVITGTAEALADPHHGLPAGYYLRLAVTDDGEGMDADTLKKATEPFFTTKGVGKGTGLGLSMVHGLAQQSGGTLILESERGRGTTAAIWLPASAGSVPPVKNRIEPVPVSIEHSPLRVLAVDDDALVLMNTVAMLEDMGHQVGEAYSGQEALDKLLDDPQYDLVITDHAMPKMTGAQLVEEIAIRWPEKSVIMATGYAELPSALRQGIRKLSKPFSQSDLERAINDAITRRGA